MLYLFQRSQANSAQKPWEMNNYWKYGFFIQKYEFYVKLKNENEKVLIKQMKWIYVKKFLFDNESRPDKNVNNLN